MENIKIVFTGAGAAGIAVSRLMLEFGVKKEQIFLCDRHGLVTKGRGDINIFKMEFAQDGKSIPLAEVIKGADVFIGVSAGNILSREMVLNMHKDAIIFALANPVPEIMPDEAYAGGAMIVATGRSDFDNQINNALCFPGLFRGTLDTRAYTINTDMKKAAARRLAKLAHEPISGEYLEVLEKAYPTQARAGLFSGNNPLKERYILPKQFDLRIVPAVATEVVRAAMESGAARVTVDDFKRYEGLLCERIGKVGIGKD